MVFITATGKQTRPLIRPGDLLCSLTTPCDWTKHFGHSLANYSSSLFFPYHGEHFLFPIRPIPTFSCVSVCVPLGLVNVIYKSIANFLETTPLHSSKQALHTVWPRQRPRWEAAQLRPWEEKNGLGKTQGYFTISHGSHNSVLWWVLLFFCFLFLSQLLL